MSSPVSRHSSNQDSSLAAKEAHVISALKKFTNAINSQPMDAAQLNQSQKALDIIKKEYSGYSEHVQDAIDEAQNVISLAQGLEPRLTDERRVNRQIKEVIKIWKKVGHVKSITKKEFDATSKSLDDAQRVFSNASDGSFKKQSKEECLEAIAKIRASLNIRDPNAWKSALATRAAISIPVIYAFGVPMGIAATLLAFGLEETMARLTPKIYQAVGYGWSKVDSLLHKNSMPQSSLKA